jgi:PIN domain nuclease of toxin-antitoxin system
MRLLVDTQLLLWAAVKQARLPSEARRMMGALDTERLFSAASIWEVAIKSGLARDEFDVDPGVLRNGLLMNGYTEVPVTSQHAAATSGLPRLHKDPFDRLLLAQAVTEGALLLTTDQVLGRYPGPVRRV